MMRPTEYWRPCNSREIVRCPCGWCGPWCEAIHTYRLAWDREVYGVTECPACGREL